jgi:hypothetical protein
MQNERSEEAKNRTILASKIKRTPSRTIEGSRGS